MSNPHYTPPTLLEDSNAIQVSNIVVAGQTPSPIEPGSDTSVNHWVIHLQMAQGGFIRLDMYPVSAFGERAFLLIKRLDDIPSGDVVKEHSFPAVPNLRARHVLDRIFDQGYHNYRYGEKMLECRYWVYTVMKDFRDAGFVRGTGMESYDLVSSTWSTEGASSAQGKVEQ